MKNLRISRSGAIIIYTTLFLIIFLIQSSPYNLFYFFGSSFELVIPFIVVVSAFEGERFGSIFGLITGIFYDSQGVFTGFYAISFLLVGLLSGLIYSFFIKRSLVTVIIISVFFVLLVNIVSMLIFHGFSNINLLLEAIYYVIIKSLKTFVIAFIFWRVVYSFRKEV